MIVALFALIAVAQDDTVLLGSVSVGGTQVDVTVPSARGPFDENTPHVEIDGFKYTVDADGNLGVRYRSDGGWGEVADAYPAVALKSASAPEYRVKVFLLTNSEILEHSRDGQWRRRRGSMSSADQQTIFESLARFKALAEVAADGRVRITFDVTVDDTLLFKAVEPTVRENTVWNLYHDRILPGERPDSGMLLGPEFVYDDIAPRIANDPFDSEEGTYSGPYSSVLVIHSGRTRDNEIYVMGRTPVTTISWPIFTVHEPGLGLSVHLFDAWHKQLAQSFRLDVLDHEYAGRYSSSPAGLRGTAPHVFERAVTTDLIERGNRLNGPGSTVAVHEFSPQADFTSASARALDFSSLSIGHVNDFLSSGNLLRLAIPAGRRHLGPLPPSYAFVMTPKLAVAGVDRRIVTVPPLLTFRFMEQHPSAVAIGRVTSSIENPFVVAFQLPEPIEFDSEIQALNIDPPTMRALRIVVPPQPVGTVAFSASATGDFAVESIDDPVVGQAVEVTETGRFRRGHAVLSSAEGLESLFRVARDTGLTFRASCDLSDTYSLQLVTRAREIVYVQMFGDRRLPAEIRFEGSPIINVSRPPQRSWSDFTVALGPDLEGVDIVEIRLGPTPFASYYERRSVGSKKLKVGAISFGEVSESDMPPPYAVNVELRWLSALEGPLDDAAVERMQMLLADEDLQKRINALGAMTRIRHPALIPHIAPGTASGSPSEAYLAIQALLHQGGDDAWRELANAAFRGPLSHNYRFAAEALGERPEEVTLTLLTPARLDPRW
ncbi:MAG: hypothetical protein IH945_09330, partial [Armatimonadetes bacterium]|nr:hypothetical protein [Armatimonadota bacterium]